MKDHNVVGDMLRELVIAESENPASLSEMERKIKRVLYWLGHVLLHVWLMWLAPRYVEPYKTCPHCGGQSEYDRKRWGCLHTLYGKIRYRRAYYMCPDCHQGHCPLDEQLGLRPNAMSAEVERLGMSIK